MFNKRSIAVVFFQVFAIDFSEDTVLLFRALDR